MLCNARKVTVLFVVIPSVLTPDPVAERCQERQSSCGQGVRPTDVPPAPGHGASILLQRGQSLLSSTNIHLFRLVSDEQNLQMHFSDYDVPLVFIKNHHGDQSSSLATWLHCASG